MRENIELSIILPCKNEERALPFCLAKIKKVIKDNKINAEIIVVDNNSTDSSPEIAKKNNVKLVYEKIPGYGSAYLAGINSALGKYIFMADADNTYDFNEIPRFLNELKNGNDFVIGDRFKGSFEKKSMPWTHKYIGNPVLSGLFRLFFKTKINDIHCGMRAIKRDKLLQLNLRTTGMEFASEMVIKAIKNKLKIKELAIDYHERKGKSKLNSFRDGWRHLRFMLLYSPMFLFFIPGLVLFLIGIFSMLWIYFGSAQIFGIKLFYHPMFFSSLLIIAGYQLIIFAGFAKTYAITHLGEENNSFNNIYKYITIEKASLLGLISIVIGIIIYVFILTKWINSGLGDLNEIKNSILALTLITIGIQTIFSSFMLSILSIKER